MSRRQAGAELPEAPGVRGELGLEIAGVPGSPTVPTHLDAADPAGTGKRDPGKLDRAGAQRSAIDRLIDSRHRLHDGALVPTIVFPVARLVFGRKADARHPF